MYNISLSFGHYDDRVWMQKGGSATALHHPTVRPARPWSVLRSAYGGDTSVWLQIELKRAYTTLVILDHLDHVRLHGSRFWFLLVPVL